MSVEAPASGWEPTNQEVPGHGVHMVGTVPQPTAEMAIRWQLKHAGACRRPVSGGETGDRANWLVGLLSRLRDHPDLELARDGSFTSYEDMPALRVRRGHTLAPDSLGLGFAAHARDERAILDDIAPDRDLLVGVPDPTHLAILAFGPARAPRYAGLMREAVSSEIHQIHQDIGRRAVVQLEVPFFQVAVAKTPVLARPAVAAAVTHMLTQVVRRAPAGMRWGVHLCLGDLGRQAVTQLPDMSPVVELANATAASWPAHAELEVLHAPVAGGDVHAPTGPAHYAPLARLALPRGTRFAAGIAHEGQSLAEQRLILAMVERATELPPDRLDVAAYCGLGRRPPAEADAAGERLLALAGTSVHGAVSA